MTTQLHTTAEQRLTDIERRLDAIQRSTDDIHGWMASIMGALQHNPFTANLMNGGR